MRSSGLGAQRTSLYTFVTIMDRTQSLFWFLLVPLIMGVSPLGLPKCNTIIKQSIMQPQRRRVSYTFPCIVLRMARRKRINRQDQDDLNRWYEDVDDNASPDDVFWEEMERQRLMNQLSTDTPPDEPAGTKLSGSTSTVYANTASSGAGSGSTGMGATTGMMMSGANGGSMGMNTAGITAVLADIKVGNNPGSTAASQVMDKKTAESILQEFSAFAVKDNWLDDDLVEIMESGDRNTGDFDSNAKSLEDQLDEWEQGADDDFESAWTTSDEPWDNWGEEAKHEEGEDGDVLRFHRYEASEFLLKDGDDEEEQIEMKLQEEKFLECIAKIKIKSKRLENARNNPKAEGYFSFLEPNAVEGYDRVWVSAIDNACFDNLMGTFRNYGIQFADNFGDWEDGCVEDGVDYSVEDIASFKARQVYEVTGLPCIASRTSFEIEPVPDLETAPSGRAAYGTGRTNAGINPRVLSGYRFNDVGMHVDYMVEALKLFSEPTRVTRFKSCLCYYDGEMEVFDYGVCDVDLHFSDSMRTFIPMAQAINEMMTTLQLTFGLEYQKWLRKRMDEATGAYGDASLKLRDRVLKEGKVLPNDIIDVSAFMDSKVDVNLMDDCAKELSYRFKDLRPTKILTVATTGLVIALPMAKYLQVPVVYARKERNVVMADTYQAGYSSKTVGKNRELLISKDHLTEDDRVLIVDDFLSSGASQDALLRIVSEAGAEAVGVGVLLEKVYDSGRQSLSGFDISVQSLCRVASVKGGVIQLVEEDGYDPASARYE